MLAFLTINAIKMPNESNQPVWECFRNMSAVDTSLAMEELNGGILPLMNEFVTITSILSQAFKVWGQDCATNVVYVIMWCMLLCGRIRNWQNCVFISSELGAIFGMTVYN